MSEHEEFQQLAFGAQAGSLASILPVSASSGRVWSARMSATISGIQKSGYIPKNVQK
jgi:hypothetical protein